MNAKILIALVVAVFSFSSFAGNCGKVKLQVVSSKGVAFGIVTEGGGTFYGFDAKSKGFNLLTNTLIAAYQKNETICVEADERGNLTEITFQ